MRPLSVDPMGQLKSGGIKLEYRKIAELVPFGIEESIIVDAGVLAENPLAVGIEISLRRFTFD